MPKFKTEEKEKAWYLYFNSNRTQADIAIMCGINAKTISEWVRKGRWAERKKAAFHSPEQEAHRLYEELRTINKRIDTRPIDERFGTPEELTAKERIINMLTKLSKSIGQWRNISPKHDTAQTDEKNGTYPEYLKWKEGDTVRILIGGEEY